MIKFSDSEKYRQGLNLFNQYGYILNIHIKVDFDYNNYETAIPEVYAS